MRCNKCRKGAVVFQEYSGQHLCRPHFDADFERKVKHEIRRHHWLEHDDHIAVALSGDRNSGALLYFLRKLTSNRRDIRISAITIDEGIQGYHQPIYAEGIARAVGTDLIRASFAEQFGVNLDEIACRKGIHLPCTYCRIIRNFLLERTATQQGVTKLAMGDDLDDCGMSVMKNILRGKVEMVARPEYPGSGKISRIHPFVTVPKKEVALYADLHIKGYDQSLCPYHNDPFENDVHTMLDRFTTRHPATGYALLGLKKSLAGTYCMHPDTVHFCERCGRHSDGICMSCQIIDEVIAGGA